MNHIRGQVRGLNLETGTYKRVRFRSGGTVGYGPTLNKKGCAILCDQVARYDGEELVSFVGNKVGTKGEGQREPFFLLVKTRRTNRQGSRPSVVTERSSTIVTRCMDKVVHQSVYISRQFSLLR